MLECRLRRPWVGWVGTEAYRRHDSITAAMTEALLAIQPMGAVDTADSRVLLVLLAA